MRSSVAPAIRHYHQLIERDLSAANEQLAWLKETQRSRNACFGGRPLAHCLRPTFLTEREYMEVEDAVHLIRQAVLKIAATFFDDERVLREGLGMREWEIELASIPTPVLRLSANARLDAFLTEQTFKFVEINGESPAGVAYSHRLQEIFRELPVFQEFTESFPVRFVSPLEHTIQSFLRVYHEEFDGREEQPTFAIVDRIDEVPTTDEFALLKEYLERRGHTCVVADPRALDCRDGWIYADGERIDLLYRRLLMSEFQEIRDECTDYLDGYRAQKTCYLNTFRGKLVHKKAILSFLTDETFTQVLSPSQQEAVQRHIPWTRLLRPQNTSFRGLKIDLLEFVRDNRTYFIIKPNDEYGGAGVTLGFEASQEEWEAAIDHGVETGAVVQEAVDIHREPFLMPTDEGWDHVPAIIDLDPYVNGPLVGGCLSRISASNLANVTAGGGTLPTFILRNTYSNGNAHT